MACVSIILKLYLSFYRLFQSFSIKNFLLSLVLQKGFHKHITLYIGVVTILLKANIATMS